MHRSVIARAAAAVGVPAATLETTHGPTLVTTVFDLMLAQYGVGRDGLPGEWPRCGPPDSKNSCQQHCGCQSQE
jgi:nitrate reductase alpha subunit